MKNAWVTRAMLAGLALFSFAVSSAALAQALPQLQFDGKPNKQAQYEVALAHMQTGKAQGCKGDLALLRYPFEDGYRRALNAAERHVKDAPTDAHRQDLLLAITKLPVRQVRPDGARSAAPDETRAATARQAAAASFASAIAILEKLLASEPEHAAWQRDLAVAYSRLAKVSGAWTKSRDLHQKAVDLQKSVVAKNAGNKAWQHDLAVMYEGLGSVQFGMGGEKPARAAKMAELELREKLADAEPANTKWQHELALNYDRLGEMFATIANVSQARDAFLAGFEIHDKLVKLDPSNLAWQLDLARNRSDAAEFERHRGKSETGAKLRQEALRLRTAIIERDPANIDAQMDLRSSYFQIARDHRSAEGDADATAVYRNALAHMQRMAAANPADPGWLYYQLELQFQIGYLIQDVIQPRLGTRTAPPPELVERVIADTNVVFQSMLATMRTLTAMSAHPETARIYETAQAPRLCTISL
ncbi:hypothetical protein [Polaromonas sp. UC242_47]|uniref:hypothetical protein n=1 Tax=Polaromonas sp. UC242_47 TaxID=3374626 RepID=UPI0037A67DA0